MSETDLRVLIIESRYYNEIAVELLAGATEALAAAGATYERVEVPGAFEIPAVIMSARKARVVCSIWRCNTPLRLATAF